jgi:hypothetical protein
MPAAAKLSEYTHAAVAASISDTTWENVMANVILYADGQIR